ncbi:Recombination inhibitory protein MutS2 [Fructilactobacillus florum 8D]|uniref:Endonuclease MutS2 n=1 Tax=Fructilactobacillus florum 8D TaxID=1221538 RepID=W9EJR6_9LACO|nr:endonuclease MutS2 [Fructilactobacillus florum]ETO39904.1 Recombination inhibitory protein MutS2 [Fructilactobacillus florum 8D]
MNKKILKTLEYKKIKTQIRDYLATDLGKLELDQLFPTSDPDLIQQQLDETDDGVHLDRLNQPLPLPRLVAVDQPLKRLEIGANLNGKELAQFSQILQTVQRINQFFTELESDHVELLTLYSLNEQLVALPELNQRLLQSVDATGWLLDTASQQLQQLRHQIEQTQATIKTKMNGYIHGKRAKYLSDTVITIRDDRYVIPVKAEAKQQFGGIVHDQSASGQTLYVEPQAVVELNNQLRFQQKAALQEEKRILAELSDELRPEGAHLAANATQLGHLDLINAKARYARFLHATKPKLSIRNEVHLKTARHPLIPLDRVVGNSIELNQDCRQLIITGPNTGGKTITMKTLGLLQLMAQSGLFIAADEGSQVGVFDEVFADIGDEQSIEQNLSTFSSHLDNIIQILQQTTARSLVLIDELGAGTDPSEGAALAMAILDAIERLHSTVLATTHYPELKAYAYNHVATENASMEFDEETLRPTYRLLMGVPGQSNALQIARRLGLSEQIVNQATAYTDETDQDLNRMITELTQQTRLARERSTQLAEKLKATTELQQELQDHFGQFQAQREQLVNQAKREANQLVAKTKREAQAVIDDLHRKQRDLQGGVKENEIIADQGKLNALEQQPALRKNRVLKRSKARQTLRVGDDVLVKNYGQQGVLLRKLGQQNWEVQLGILKMKVAESNLEKQGNRQQPTKGTPMVRRTKSAAVPTTLDLRGVRYDDAMHRLDQYLDAALLAGYPTVTIVHGKGTGALRTGVTKVLSRHRQVQKFSFAPPSAGGDGATVVTFK